MKVQIISPGQHNRKRGVDVALSIYLNDVIVMLRLKQTRVINHYGWTAEGFI